MPNYKILQKAFQDGNITDSQFILYLYRWRQIKFGKRLIIKSPYRIDDELHAYEKALNLDAY